MSFTRKDWKLIKRIVRADRQLKNYDVKWVRLEAIKATSHKKLNYTYKGQARSIQVSGSPRADAKTYGSILVQMLRNRCRDEQQKAKNVS